MKGRPNIFIKSFFLHKGEEGSWVGGVAVLLSLPDR
jgi:hypothetical protein